MPLKNIVLCEPIIIVVEMEGGSPFYLRRKKKILFQDSPIALPQANFSYSVAHKNKKAHMEYSQNTLEIVKTNCCNKVYYFKEQCK